MLNKNLLQLLCKSIILLFTTQCYFSYGIPGLNDDHKINLITDSSYSTTNDLAVIVKDLKSFVIADDSNDELETIIVNVDSPETLCSFIDEDIHNIGEFDSWTIDKLYLDVINEEELRKLFGESFPKESLLMGGFADLVATMGLRNLVDEGNKGIEYVEYVYDNSKDLIISHIRELADHYATSVKYQAENSNSTPDEKRLHKKEGVIIINKLLVCMLKIFSYDTGNENYAHVAHVDSDGTITINLWMAKDEEEKKLLERFIDVHLSDIEMFKNKKIKPDESSLFYYSRYYKWVKDETIRLILKEKDRTNKTLLYLYLLSGIHGDIVSNYIKWTWDNNPNKDFMESLEVIGRERYFNDK